MFRQERVHTEQPPDKYLRPQKREKIKMKLNYQRNWKRREREEKKSAT